MRKVKLPEAWRSWRRERLRALLADGWPRTLADHFASYEARGRYRVAQTIGDTAAMTAKLHVEFTEGSMRAFLHAPLDDLPDDATRELARAFTQKTLGTPVLN